MNIPSPQLLIFLFAFLFAWMGAFCQTSKTTFKGIIVDETDQRIPGATIMVLHVSDSVLVQFGASDVQGAFTIKNVPKGDYLLHVTFLGLAPVYTPITSGVSEEIDLGKINMLTSSKILSEVEVKADIIPVDIKKDTITYNADAFKTQPNDVVEDLLKKLPGIEVATDGTITAQGEQVQKVTVDGKEFFGTDPKMATKNLPANAIKKVKVFDKKSDVADFTGVDDGEREKTIDLQLREEFKEGLFGTAEAGYGTDSRYMGRAAFNRFSKTSQLSLLGQLNNVNEQGFSFNDMMSFSGRGMSSGGGGRTTEVRVSSEMPFNESFSNGSVNTAAGGINFNWHKSKNFNIRSSYFYNGVNKDLLQEVFRQNLTDNPFDTEENTTEATDNSNHRLTMESTIKPDTTQQIEITARMSFGKANGLNGTLLRNILAGGTPESESFTNEDNKNESISLRAGSTYMKRLGKSGRNISANLNFSNTGEDNQSSLQALTEFFNTGETELLDQLQFANTDNMAWEGQLSYTEPLKKRRFLEFNYFYSRAESDFNKDVSDIINTAPVPNSMLSNSYTSIFSYHRPGMTFRYSGNIHNVNVGLQYQISELRGHLNQNEILIGKDYAHFLPRVIWRYDIGNGKNLRFNYNTRVNQPSISQLSPVIDNSNPQRLYIGNPNLNAEYNHNVGLNFHSFTQFSSTSFFASLNGTFTKDKIITSRSFDDQLRELSTPINIAGESRYTSYVSYGRPFKPIHSRVTVNGNLSYTNTQNLINSELLDLNRWSRSAGITINNMNSEVLEYNLGGKWTFSDSYYKTDESLNQNTLLHNYFVDLTLTVWKKWQIKAGYEYNLYTSDAFGDDQSLPLMEASISRYVLPGDKGQIVLSVFDALDENRGLSRNVDINYIEEIRSNSIGRYVMLKFIYSVRGRQKSPQGGMQIFHRQ